MQERCGLVTVVEGSPGSVSCLSFRVRRASRRRRLLSWIAVGSLILLNAMAGQRGGAQSANAPQDGAATSLLSVPPRSLVVDAAANELIALHHKDSYLRYRMETVNEKGVQVRDVIESKDGTVARLILKDGKPLTPEQDQGERQRLNDMIASPAGYAKHVKNTESEKKMA